MKVDMNSVRDYEARGLLTVRAHQGRNALVLNYTPECAYSRAWDDLTRVCRGLVVQADGTVIGNSMPKFFNLGEPEVGPIPNEVPQVWEKADGVLGIIFWDPEKKEWDVTSRGNPHSPFAEWARTFLPKAYPTFIRLANTRWTYLVEILYPGSHIVVNYGETQELRLLAARSTGDGHELQVGEFDLENEAKALGMPVTQRFRQVETSTPADRMAEDHAVPNAEGFVLFYPSTGLRVKVKFAEYRALHRNVFGLSTKSVWEALRDGKAKDEFLSVFSDEALKKWAASEWEAQEKQFRDVLDLYTVNSVSCQRAGGASQADIRRGVWESCEDACLALNQVKHEDDPPFSPGIMMSIVQGKTDQAAQVIWKTLRPKFARPGALHDLEKEST